MRTRHIIQALFLSLFFAACARPVEMRHGTSLPTDMSPELSAIDSLMWQRPDSALMCLLPYFDTCCRDGVHTVSTTHDCHYANLLLAELLYKNDNPQLNRAELLRAVDYYDSLCCRDAARHVSTDPILMFLDARAHYINGVGYYERDSVVEACQEYLKALEVMEGRFEEKELVGNRAQFMALSFTRLAELYSGLYLHEQAIHFAKSSLAFFKRYASSSTQIAWVLDEIGSHYDMMLSYDSACVYYEKSIEVLHDTNNLLYRDLTAHRILLSYQTDKDANTALHQFYQLLALSNSDKEYLSRCLSIGDIFFHESQLDSAFKYLSVVYNDSESCNTKKQAAEWLVNICKAQGKDSEAYEFAEFLVPFANLNENNSHLKSQLAELCNGYEQSKQKNAWQLHQQNGAVKPNAFVIGGIALALLLGSIYFLVIYKKRQNAEPDKKPKSDAATNPSQVLPSSFAACYADEPICRHILAVCNDKKSPIKSTVPYSAYSGISLDDTQMAQLKKAANHHYGMLFEHLAKEHPELKGKDYQYCYLCLLGLDNVQIAALLQKSNSTIWEREKRLQKIFGCNDKIAIILHEMITNS
ncbi:MAG: hypothetical protein II829_06145 [Bacteroidales bacterium]|nr:hypothetical protein [Bacteroidales bacterium]